MPALAGRSVSRRTTLSREKLVNTGFDRRRILAGASGIATSLILPSWGAAATAAPLSPERSLESYRRMLCGAKGEEVLWWFIGDLYYHSPGKAVVPVARTLTIGGYTAGEASPRAFRYRFREAGVIIDLKTGLRLERNPLTGVPAEVPLVDEEPHDIDWVVQDDGNILKTQNGKTAKLNLTWTETSSNLLLLENTPGDNAFSLAPGDSGVDWKQLESTRTVYAKRAALVRPGFVPANMIFNVALKLSPPWLANGETGDHFFIVRGIGEKSRRREIVNQDAFDIVRRYFPKYL